MPAQGASRAPAPVPAASGPALGLTEDDAALLWSPASGPADPRLARAREQLSALHPAYIRLLIDWAKLQPDPRRAPELEGAVAGCARASGPCVPYAGVRGELEAIASQQRRAPGSFQVVVQVLGTPAWAAQPPAECEGVTGGPFSRAPSESGLAAYKALVRDLLALAGRVGVDLPWWSPWNEPNGPRFLSPQRAACDAAAPALAPAQYARLVHAMAAELRAAPGQHRLLLGELAAYESDTPDRTGIASFVAALPADVLCAGPVWTVHAYAIHAHPEPPRDPVAALEAALDRRGGCARDAQVWVTEAGAGAPHPGRARSASAGEALAGCVALAGQLARWAHDPRVGAVFQFTFREDPAFPVGLVSAGLSHTYPAYRLLAAWAQARAAGRPPPGPAACL